MLSKRYKLTEVDRNKDIQQIWFVAYCESCMSEVHSNFCFSNNCQIVKSFFVGIYCYIEAVYI